MNKTLKKTLAVVFALAMLLMVAVPSFAVANETIHGTTTTDRHVISLARDYSGLSSVDAPVVPTVTFTHTMSGVSGTNGVVVAATKNADGTLKSPTVYATANNTAMVEGVPTAANAVFSPSDGLGWNGTYGIGGVDNATNTVVPGTSEEQGKYAYRNFTIDFTGVTFKSPGVYRFKMQTTMSPASVSGLSSVDTADRYIDVYVNQNTSSTTEQDLLIAGYTIHKSANAIPDVNANWASNLKEEGLSARYATKSLTVSKVVDGNQGSKNQEFNFTLTITGAEPGATFPVTLYNEAEVERILDAATNSSDPADFTDEEIAMLFGMMVSGGYVKPNSRTGLQTSNLVLDESVTGLQNRPITVVMCSLVANSSGNATYNFKMKNGDKLVLENLTESVQYSVTEDNQDYNPSWSLDAATDASGTTNTVSSRAIGAQSNEVVFTNTREVPVATGVVLTVLPFMLLVVAAVAAGLYITARRKKADEEESSNNDEGEQDVKPSIEECTADEPSLADEEENESAE